MTSSTVAVDFYTDYSFELINILYTYSPLDCNSAALASPV
jgi:hypothetical protein